MRTINTIGLIKLTRYQEYVAFVGITTLLGFVVSDPLITTSTLLKLLIVFLANMLSVCFSFMINDVEDAPDDAVSPDKTMRNPISAGMLSRRTGLWVSSGTAFAALLTFYPLGTTPFILGIVTVGLGLTYSWKWIRLKSIPVIDILSHGLMLAALQFLCSYFTFTSFRGFIPQFILPLLLVTSLSMYGELYNEMRDFTYDKIAGIQHTAALIGKTYTYMLMYIFLIIAALTIFSSIFLNIIPLWIVAVFMIIGGIFILHLHQRTSIRRISIIDVVQDYILRTTGITLSIWACARIIGL